MSEIIYLNIFVGKLHYRLTEVCIILELFGYMIIKLLYTNWTHRIIKYIIINLLFEKTIGNFGMAKLDCIFIIIYLSQKIVLKIIKIEPIRKKRKNCFLGMSQFQVMDFDNLICYTSMLYPTPSS